MEATRGRRTHARVAVADGAARVVEDDECIDEKPLVLRDDALRRWKQARLAHHHAYFALLDRSFSRWKRVTLARRQRRQRVMAACRVGARFFQRLYWEQWTTVVARRREARDVAARRLRSVVDKIRLQAVFSDWKATIVASRKTTQGTSASVEHVVGERRLEVRGLGLQKHTQTASVGRAWEPLPHVDPKLQTQRSQSLRRITVYYTQRHYFQLWQKAARAVTKMITQQLRGQADSFRLRSAWKRWRRGLRAHSERRMASRQAVFFLYYHLTRSSMDQLRRYADRQRQARRISVVLASRIRRRNLESAFSLWRQRLNTKVVFSHWRDVVREGNSGRHPNPHLQAVHQIVSGLSHRRLLSKCFEVWLQQSITRRRSQALSRVVEGTLSKSTLEPAFRLWQQRTVMQRQLQDRRRRREHDRLQHVWQVWAQFTKDKQVREQQRRTAMRFWYYRELRRCFTAFQKASLRHSEIDTAVEAMLRARAQRQTRCAFDKWAMWCKHQRRRRDSTCLAQTFHEVTLKKHVVRALSQTCEDARDQDRLAKSHAREIARKRLRDAFHSWTAFHAQQQQRNQHVQRRLAEYVDKRKVRVMKLVLDTLEDHAKHKQSNRLVSAHARGHYQSCLQQKSFSIWVSSVAQQKWRQVFSQRANRFRDQKLMLKCFVMWSTNVCLIRRHREKTRMALHHWKRVRERHAFERWKSYLRAHQCQRLRMHEALEFRHKVHIRGGLTRWIAGAALLTQDRTRRTVQLQSSHTERVWRKVREIATHWRYIAHKNKLTGRLQQHEDVGRKTVDRVNQLGRFKGNALCHPALHAGGVGRHQLESDLPDFVMLPRNRPRPRKTIELILESGAPVDVAHESPLETTEVDLYPTVGAVNRHYGVQFPVGTTTIVDAARHRQMALAIDDNESTGLELCGVAQRSPPSDHMPSRLEECGSTIDELEQRLLSWQARRLRLKQLQQSLEAFRQTLDQAFSERNVENHELEFMRSRLRAMEEQEASSRRRWNESRPEILSLARRVKLLRSGMIVSA